MKESIKLMTVLLLTIISGAQAQGSLVQTEADNKSWLEYAEEPRCEDDVLYIESAGNLAWLAQCHTQTTLDERATNDILQTADIDLSAHGWFPIGTNIHSFIGNYNGGGHIITGMKCSGGDSDHIGLFGKVGAEKDGTLIGSITDVVLLNSEVSGKDYVGGICGYTLGRINHCITDAKVSGQNHVGGLIGGNDKIEDVSGSSEQDVIYPFIQNNLYIGSSVTATNSNAAAVIGKIDYKDVFKEEFDYIVKNNYYTNAVMAGLNSFDVQAFPIYTTSPELMLRFNSDPKGVEYQSRQYIPKTGAKVTVDVLDTYIAAEVKLNGRPLGTGTGTYDVALQDGESEAVITANVTMKTLEGEGTTGSPYLIKTTEDWNIFAALVKGGTTYWYSYIRLDADITVSQMVGTSEHPFEGYFDGNGHTLTFNAGTESEPLGEDYCAPFRYYHNTSIKKLTVKGDIYTKARYAAGLVAQLQGTYGTPALHSEFEDCRSSIVIHSSYSGAAYHSGFVAERVSRDYGTQVCANFNRCVFDGKLLGGNSTDCSGFVAKDDGRTTKGANITCCLFVPQDVTLTGNNSNFTNGPLESVTNSYYVNWDGTTKQGRQGYVYDYYSGAYGAESVSNNFMTSYAKAIKFDDKYYSSIVHIADAGDNTDLIESLNGKTVDACFLGRTLYKDGSWNTLCLPFDVTLSGSVLDGAVVRPLNAGSISGTTLNLNFGDAVSTLTAGTPYIIKWPTVVTVYTAVSGTGSSASSEDYAKLLDGSVTTKWCASNGPWECVFTTSSPVAVTGYTLTTATDATLYYTRNPRRWTLEAKANAADAWTTIDSRDVTANSSDALPTTNSTESQVYSVAGGDKVYQHFRFTVSQTGGSQMQLAELKLQGDLASLSPVFEGVTIDAVAKHDYDNAADGDRRVRFIGMYASQSFGAENKSILFMGAGNTLYYPLSGTTIGAQRAYFKVGSDDALARRLTVFNIGFGDGETANIENVQWLMVNGQSESWYTLDGRRLTGKPTTKGLYINNGKKKIVIK